MLNFDEVVKMNLELQTCNLFNFEEVVEIKL